IPARPFWPRSNMWSVGPIGVPRLNSRRGHPTPAKGAGRPCSLAAQLPRDHHLLHLIRALPDREDLGVAVEAADGVLLDEAIAAVDLDGLLGCFDREAAGDQLGLGGGEGEGLA